MAADKNEKNDRKIPRRSFIGFAWAAAGVALFGQAAVAFLRFFQPRVEEGGFGGKVIAGLVEEFEPGTISHVAKGNFFISRLEDGGMLAMWHRCTHLGCTVPWRDDMGHFHCPCHSSIFNTVGEVLSGPAPRPLDLFPIEIVEGQVIVDTSEAAQRKDYNPDQALYI